LFKAHSVLALKSLRPQQGVDQVTQQPGSDERGERNPAPSIDRRSENIKALIPHYTEIQVAQHGVEPCPERPAGAGYAAATLPRPRQTTAPRGRAGDACLARSLALQCPHA
jgi:hypothetical protein